jgi:hypothetical protein
MIWLLFAVPLALFQYFGTEDQTKIYGALADVLQNASKNSDSDKLLKALQGKPIFNVWTVLTFVWVFLVAPLPRAALMMATSALYLGRKIDVGSAYRTALRRWPNLIGLAILWAICAGTLATFLFFVLFVVIFGLVLVTAALHNVGVVIDIIVGIVATVALIAVALVGVVTYEMGAYACVVEDLGFVPAFVSGIQRVFSQAGFRRALVFGLAYIAITIGISFVAAIGQGVLLGLIRNQILGMAFTVVVGILTAGFVTGFFSIFYFDLRVRKEGLDLQLAAAAVSPDALSTA